MWCRDDVLLEYTSVMAHLIINLVHSTQYAVHSDWVCSTLVSGFKHSLSLSSASQSCMAAGCFTFKRSDKESDSSNLFMSDFLLQAEFEILHDSGRTPCWVVWCSFVLNTRIFSLCLQSHITWTRKCSSDYVLCVCVCVWVSEGMCVHAFVCLPGVEVFPGVSIFTIHFHLHPSSQPSPPWQHTLWGFWVVMAG